MLALNLGGEGEIPGVINQQGPWALSPNWRSSRAGKTLQELVADGHVFRVEETHGRVLRTGNEIISQSTDIGWRSLYAAKFREAPLSVSEPAIRCTLSVPLPTASPRASTHR